MVERAKQGVVRGHLRAAEGGDGGVGDGAEEGGARETDLGGNSEVRGTQLFVLECRNRRVF